MTSRLIGLGLSERSSCPGKDLSGVLGIRISNPDSSSPQPTGSRPQILRVATNGKHVNSFTEF